MLGSRQEVKERLQQLAKQTAATGNQQAAQRLNQLAEAVDGGPDADAWAANDLYQLIDVDGIVDYARSGKVSETVLGVLEWLRNSLIFLPLVVTWYGIYQALEQYRAAVSTNKDLATQPFLLLWQEGFNNSGGALTLGQLAFIDAILLLGVFLLSIVVHARADVLAVRRDETETALRLRAELGHVLSAASLNLTARRWQQPTNFVDHFDTVSKRLLTEIAAERQRLIDLANQRAKEFGDLSTFSTSLKESSEKMLQAALRMAALQQAQVELKDNVGKLATSVADLATSQQQLLVAATTAGNKLNAIASEQQAMGQDLRDAIANLRVAETHIGQVAGSITATANTLATQLTGLLSAITAERQAHTNIASVVSKATAGVDQSLRQVDAYANTLHGMAIDLGNLVGSVPGLATQVQTGMQNVAREQNEAAVGLLRASSNLEDAAQALDLAVRQLQSAGQTVGA